MKPVRMLPAGWEERIGKKEPPSSPPIYHNLQQIWHQQLTNQQSNQNRLELALHLALRERDTLLHQYELVCAALSHSDRPLNMVQPQARHTSVTPTQMDNEPLYNGLSQYDEDPMTMSTLSAPPNQSLMTRSVMDTLNGGDPPSPRSHSIMHRSMYQNQSEAASPKWNQSSTDYLAMNGDQSELSSPNQRANKRPARRHMTLPSSLMPMSEQLVEPVDEMQNSESSTWEHLSVVLERVSGYGFGIAVSGGRDNPHFKNGDPSIVVSDVLHDGPAWTKLQINDRIVSANNVNLEDADYQSAVQIMKDTDQLNMIVKRRIPLPTVDFEQRTLKFTLTKSKRKDTFGIVLGCKYYIKHITNPKLAEKEPGLKEGDTVIAVNGQSCDALSFSEAQKMLEKSRDRLAIVVQRDVPRGTPWRWGSQTTLYERLGSVVDTPRDSPRASPSVNHQRMSEDGRMSLPRIPRVHPARMASSEYMQPGTSGHGHVSEYGAVPRAFVGMSPRVDPRSRTPSRTRQGLGGDMSADEYSVYGVPKMMAPQTPSTNRSTVSPDAGYLVDGRLLVAESPTSQMPRQFPGSSLMQADNAQTNTAPNVTEPRVIQFKKEGGSVGVRVIGGNEVGIFVSAVQQGSPAAAQGVKPGDKILSVNGSDMRHVTREEAVIFLLGLDEQVELSLQYRKDEYNRVRTQNLGDNFCIRAHFDYEKPENNGEMSFKRGDIFQVTDTLYGGAVGSWQAIKLTAPASTPSSPEAPHNKGIIPNQQRADKAHDTQRAQRSASAGSSRDSAVSKTGTFLRRKMGFGKDGSRRSKSLTKSHWDDMAFAQDTVNFPAYERVKLKHPGFLRPVVLFGPLADLARENLLKDFPLRFAAPVASDNDPNGNTNNQDTEALGTSANGIMKLSDIKEIINKNKHCLLDVTPSSVEKLQHSQFCPIVIYLGVESRSRLRQLRDVKGMPKIAAVSTKKLIEQAAKLQKHATHLFTATLDATKEDKWFDALLELVQHLQERRVWMAEKLTPESIDDDFLFPMAASRNYMTDSSDVDSMKGDYSSEVGQSPRHSVKVGDSPYGVVSQSQYANGNMHSSRPELSTSTHASPLLPNGFAHGKLDQLAYGNSVSHFATLRRRPAPPPPPAPSVPSRPQPPTKLRDPITSPLYADALKHSLPIDDDEDVKPEGNKGTNEPASGSTQQGAGLYSVQQILADQIDELEEAAASLQTRLDQRTPSPHNQSSTSSYYNNRLPRVTTPRMSANQRPPLSPNMMPNASYRDYDQHQPVANSTPYNNQPMFHSIAVNNSSSAFNRTGSMPTPSMRTNGLSGPVHRHNVPPPAPPSRPIQPSTTLATAMTVSTSASSSSDRHSSTPDDKDTNTMLRISSAEESTPSPRSAPLAAPDSDRDSSSIERNQNNKPPIAQKPNGIGAPNGHASGIKPTMSRAESTASDSTVTTVTTSNHVNGHAHDNSIDNMNVVAHVSGVFDSQGGSLVSEDTGVTIVVPEGALPPGKSQEIFFKVCRGDSDTEMAPPLDTEKGETLLSPLVMCGPQGLSFLRPVELRLPHSASTVNSNQWSFALKSASGAQSEWKQVSLTDDKAGHLNENYVSVTIDHF